MMWLVPKDAMFAEVSGDSERHSAGSLGASKRAAMAIERFTMSSLVSAITPRQLGLVRPASLRISGWRASATRVGMSA